MRVSDERFYFGILCYKIMLFLYLIKILNIILVVIFGFIKRLYNLLELYSFEINVRMFVFGNNSYFYKIY